MNSIEFMRDVLQRIATGPTLSKDLAREDARRAMRIVLDGEADDVQAAIFLIALRMKRETDEELIGVLEAIQQGIAQQSVAVDNLVTLVDPYDGYLRGTPLGPFVPAVLAALDTPALSHGMKAMGPKFGASHEAVLKAAAVLLGSAKEVADTSLQQAASQLADADCGWAYVSQTQLAPELAALTELRTRIVKRPCLTTIECCLNAFIPRQTSLVVTGFVHKPYPPIYATLARAAGFSQSLMIRGVEGGIVPSLTQAARYFTGASADSLRQVDLDPGLLGIEQQERAVGLPVDEQVNDKESVVRSVKMPGNPFAKCIAEHSAQVGLNALNGEEGAALDSVAYSAGIILHAAGWGTSLEACMDAAREVVHDGSALARFLAAFND